MSIAEFTAAWNARDPEAVAACFEPDGVRVQTAHPPERIEGRGALVAHVGAIMAAAPWRSAPRASDRTGSSPSSGSSAAPSRRTTGRCRGRGRRSSWSG